MTTWDEEVEVLIEWVARLSDDEVVLLMGYDSDGPVVVAGVPAAGGMRAWLLVAAT